MTDKPFQYDPPCDLLWRLFKLDLNGPDAPLSGKLLSSTSYQIAWQRLEIRRMFASVLGDDTSIISQLGDGNSGYDALSYTWGTDAQLFPLHLSVIGPRLRDGKVVLDYEPHRSGLVYIQHNLRDFLLEMRCQNYNRFIWIDAICIDQGSSEDKNRQIPGMRHIYENSQNILIWLGEASRDEKAVLSEVPYVTAKLLSYDPQTRLDAELAEIFESSSLSPPHSNTWSTLRKFLTHPWWSRLWTLQEVTASGYREDESSTPLIYILFGDTKLNWKIFEDLVLAIEQAGLRDWLLSQHFTRPLDNRHAFDCMKEVKICREELRGNGWGIPLGTLILATRRRKATVAADYVLGQISLLDYSSAQSLAMDYTRPAKDIFVAFGKYYIRQEMRECLLNHVSRKEKLKDLPSWCPNFASEETTIPLGSNWFGSSPIPGDKLNQIHHAGLTREGKWKLPRKRLAMARGVVNLFSGKMFEHGLHATTDPRKVQLVQGTDHILLSGVELDEVADVIECNNSTKSSDFLSHESVRETKSWNDACISMTKRTLTSNRYFLDIYTRTILANRTISRLPGQPGELSDSDHDQGVSPYLEFQRFIDQLVKEGGQAVTKPPPLAYKFAQALQRMTSGRTFFATKSGRIGLGPSDARIGDRLCVAFYCPTPYLLRGVTNTTHHNLIGEVFVHGLMNGEALEMLDKGQVSETKWIVE